MPLPTLGTTTSRPELGKIAADFALNSYGEGFIGPLIMPSFPSALNTAEYPIIMMDDFLREVDTSRAMDGGYNRDDFSFSMGTFACKENGFETRLDQRMSAVYKRLFDAEKLSAINVTRKVLASRELRVARKVMNPANAGATHNTAVSWKDFANASILAEIDKAKDVMKYSFGLKANTVVMSDRNFSNIMRAAELKDYMKFTQTHLTQPVEAQRAMLSSYFKLNVIIADAFVNKAKKGKDKQLEPIWGDDYIAVMCTSLSPIDLTEPCFGKTFVFTGDSGSLSIETYWEDRTRAMIYRARQDTDEAIVFKGANYLIGGVNAAVA